MMITMGGGRICLAGRERGVCVRSWTFIARIYQARVIATRAEHQLSDNVLYHLGIKDMSHRFKSFEIDIPSRNNIHCTQ